MIDSTYNFANLDGQGIRSAAGLVAGGNIIVNADTKGSLTPAKIDIVGLTDILASGHIDVDTDGSVILTEITGDLRVGTITSEFSDVTLTAPDGSIIDAVNDANDAVAYTGTIGDVNGNNITMTSIPGTIGTASDPLEINSSYSATGDLTATALQGVYIVETHGDLNVAKVLSQTADVTLITRSGSILDGTEVTSGLEADVLGNNIVLKATGGSIGQATEDLEIDSAYSGPGVLTAFADNSIFLTEVTYDGANSNTLRVLKAKATTGDVRLTVPDLLSVGQDLILVDAGQILGAGTEQTIASSGDHAEITAGNSILLQVGDNVTTTDASQVIAGHNIDVYGDYQNVDPQVGTVMDLRGAFTPGPGATDRTAFFGNVDDDTFTFNQTYLGGQTFAYGSNTPTPAGATAPLHDGSDTFVVNQLKSMGSSRPLVVADHGVTVRRDTLDLDGQAGTDMYTVNTTGSQSAAASDYVINVLDTGAKDDGVDTLTVDGVDPTTGQAGDTSGNDLFLLRKAAYLVGRPGRGVARVRRPAPRHGGPGPGPCARPARRADQLRRQHQRPPDRQRPRRRRLLRHRRQQRHHDPRRRGRRRHVPDRPGLRKRPRPVRRRARGRVQHDPHDPRLPEPRHQLPDRHLRRHGQRQLPGLQQPGRAAARRRRRQRHLHRPRLRPSKRRRLLDLRQDPPELGRRRRLDPVQRQRAGLDRRRQRLRQGRGRSAPS